MLGNDYSGTDNKGIQTKEMDNRKGGGWKNEEEEPVEDFDL